MAYSPEDMELAISFLPECYEDYIDLWMILAEVKQRNPIISDPDAVEHAIRVVEALLATGEVELMDYGADCKFHVWKTSTEESLQRIWDKWEELGREPMFNEICSVTAKRP